MKTEPRHCFAIDVTSFTGGVIFPVPSLNLHEFHHLLNSTNLKPLTVLRRRKKVQQASSKNNLFLLLGSLKKYQISLDVEKSII